MKSRALIRRGAPIGGLLAFFVAWGLASLFLNPLVLPSPRESAISLYNNGFYAKDLANSLFRTGVSVTLVMLGGLVAMRMFFFWPLLGASSSWVLGFWRSVPPIVLLPAVFILIGEREYVARIALATTGTLPIFMANIVAGLRGIPPSRIETIKLFSQGSQRAAYKHVVSREMIPHILVGFRIVFAFCLIIIVVSEMVWGTVTPGIGTRVRDVMSSSDSAAAWGMLILLGIVGVLVNWIVDALELKLVPWREVRS